MAQQGSIMAQQGSITAIQVMFRSPRHQPANAPPQRNENCEVPGWEDYALKCARTCLLCCERKSGSSGKRAATSKCQNPPDSAAWCDTHTESECNAYALGDVLRDKCPALCDTCGQARMQSSRGYGGYGGAAYDPYGGGIQNTLGCS